MALPPHDLVLCAHVGELTRPGAPFLGDAARWARRWVVVVRDCEPESDKLFFRELYPALLGRSYGGGSDYGAMLDDLADLGVHPEIVALDYRSDQPFADLDEACDFYEVYLGASGPEARGFLRNFLAARLVREPEGWWRVLEARRGPPMAGRGPRRLKGASYSRQRQEQRRDAMDLDALLTNTADGVCAVGVDGRIVFWNPAAERLLGYAAREVVGKPCCEIFVGRDPAGNRLCYQGCHVRTLVKRGRPSSTSRWPRARRPAGRCGSTSASSPSPGRDRTRQRPSTSSAMSRPLTKWRRSCGSASPRRGLRSTTGTRPRISPGASSTSCGSWPLAPARGPWRTDCT